MLTALGLAALVASSDQAFTLIRLGGGLYLIGLAIVTFRKLDAAPDADGAPRPRAALLRGVMTNLLNPKIVVFYLAFLPGFTTPDAGPLWVQILGLAGVFTLMGTSVLIIVALLAGMAGQRLSQTPAFRKGLNVVAGTAFGVLGLRLLLSRPT